MTVETAGQRVSCAVCAQEFRLAEIIDLNTYPVCRPCLERVSREVPTTGGGRKFVKINDGKMIAGVCGGLARYSNMDPTMIRILAFIGAFMTGGALVALYIVLAFVMPVESDAVA
jgi:phage shock protein C